MERDPKYTIVVQDKTFILTKSQIQLDSPNYFTACFLGNFHESQTRRLELSRDPALFRVILNYLCGYTVLPLNEEHIPTYMTPNTALVNLRADATFYQLDGLIQACDELLSNQNPAPREKHMALLGRGHCRDSEELDLAFLDAIDDYNIAFVTPDKLEEAPFTWVVDPTSVGNFMGFRILAAVERVLTLKLGTSYQKEWRLIGWGINSPRLPQRPYELVILLESTRAPSD